MLCCVFSIDFVRGPCAFKSFSISAVSSQNLFSEVVDLKIYQNLKLNDSYQGIGQYLLNKGCKIAPTQKDLVYVVIYLFLQFIFVGRRQQVGETKKKQIPSLLEDFSFICISMSISMFLHRYNFSKNTCIAIKRSKIFRGYIYLGSSPYSLIILSTNHT